MSRAAVLAGLGAWAPSREIGNADLAARLGVTDDWIRSRTGISARRVADPELSTADLAVRAGDRALRSAGLSEVDAVLVATTTPDRIVPATAPSVAARLACHHAPAFDLNAACAGFVYGLAVAGGLISTGAANSVLVIGAETMSRITNPDDPVTAPLFGDGAGAVVLRAGDSAEPGALGPFDLHSAGEHADLIKAGRHTSGYVTMAGKEVFLAAVTNMASSSMSAVTNAGHALSDVDRVVGHQANIRILQNVAKQLDLPQERLVTNIERFGNTSSASIPLALADGVTTGALRPGHLVLLTAFGAGFTWGSVTVRWPDINVEPVD